MSSVKKRQRGSARSVGGRVRLAVALRGGLYVGLGFGEVDVSASTSGSGPGPGSVVGSPPQAATSSSAGSHPRMARTTREAPPRPGSVAPMTELHELTALEQGALIRAGEVSSEDLATAMLERIAEVNDQLGAFQTVTAEEAHLASRGHAPSAADGPLAGVPTAIKDLNATKGVRTTFGSAAFADHVPTFDDEVVRRIAAAGMVSLGKTTDA